MGAMQQAMVMAAAAGVASQTDTFATNTIANYTEYASGSGSWAVTSGYMGNTATANQSILTRNGVSFADGSVSCVITRAEDAGLALRLVDNNNYYVAVIHDENSSSSAGTIQLYKKVGGSFTQLGSNYFIPLGGFTRDTSHTFAFSVSGTTLTVTFDGSVKITQTDSALSTGLCGMRAHSTANNRFDEFTCPV